MFDSFRFVLVQTSHSGNIGAAARAMKTMGFSNLTLVSPKDYPSDEATARASTASDVLENAVVVETLEEALADCHYVIGASARSRSMPWPLQTPKVACKKMTEKKGQQCAIIFGRERSGLTNEELACCHAHVQIPANPDYSSLNLAAAVQVLAYELRCQLLEEELDEQPSDEKPATGAQLEGLFGHLEQTMVDIDFLDANNPRQLISKMRRLFLRAQVDEVEVNILRGVLSAMNKQIKD